MTVRLSPWSLAALGPGAAPHTGPSCARNPAPTAPGSPTASAPDSRWWSGVRLDRSGVVAGVVAGVVVTSDTDRGGGVRNNAVWVSGRHMQLSLVMFVFFVVCRPRRDAPAQHGEDGSDPHFFAAGAARRRGECQPRCQAPCQTLPHAVGVAPVRMYPCGKAPRPRQLAGHRRPACPADRRRTLRPAVGWNRDGLSPLGERACPTPLGRRRRRPQHPQASSSWRSYARSRHNRRRCVGGSCRCHQGSGVGGRLTRDRRARLCCAGAIISRSAAGPRGAARRGSRALTADWAEHLGV